MQQFHSDIMASSPRCSCNDFTLKRNDARLSSPGHSGLSIPAELPLGQLWEESERAFSYISCKTRGYKL